MSPLLIVIAILLFGTLLFIAEVFLMPSFILGKIGFVVTIVGLAFAFYELGILYGSICVIAAIVINGVLLYIGADRISESKMAVQTVVDGKVNEFVDFGLKVGDIGITLTDLRPEGKAIFGDNRVSVWSFNEFISADKNINIVQIKDNKIFVKEA
ncbi:MAG: hypothetical protein H6553_07420 [Chitinophagales bacterium]|nr:hypothetical protein [Chitinophagales bacterium]